MRWGRRLVQKVNLPLLFTLVPFCYRRKIQSFKKCSTRAPYSWTSLQRRLVKSTSPMRGLTTMPFTSSKGTMMEFCLQTLILTFSFQFTNKMPDSSYQVWKVQWTAHWGKASYRWYGVDVSQRNARWGWTRWKLWSHLAGEAQSS